MRAIQFVSRRKLSMNVFEQAIAKKATQRLVETLDMNSKIIEVPIISAGDPSNIPSWEWTTGLDLSPKYKLEDLKKKCVGPDPFALVSPDLSDLSGGIRELLGSDHPVLESCARYFFEKDGSTGGKNLRPSLLILISYALNNLKANPLQLRLAEITEMIHTASLFHDDVIDKAEKRRGKAAVNLKFGNKIAILGGDFLLARASLFLVRLRNLEVIELMSGVLEHLVKGEVMQMKRLYEKYNKARGEEAEGIETTSEHFSNIVKNNSISSTENVNGNSLVVSPSTRVILDYYLRKNFYKTASLMAHSCLSAAILGAHTYEEKRAAYLYGVYIGQAFQLIDDALDFEGTTSTLGKAPLADIKSGLITAPLLFASEKYPELIELASRNFQEENDLDRALELLNKSNGLESCRLLAQVHIEKALEAIEIFPPSEAKDALKVLAIKVITRSS